MFHVSQGPKTLICIKKVDTCMKQISIYQSSSQQSKTYDNYSVCVSVCVCVLRLFNFFFRHIIMVSDCALSVRYHVPYT